MLNPLFIEKDQEEEVGLDRHTYQFTFCCGNQSVNKIVNAIDLTVKLNVVENKLIGGDIQRQRSCTTFLLLEI